MCRESTLKDRALYCRDESLYCTWKMGLAEQRRAPHLHSLEERFQKLALAGCAPIGCIDGQGNSLVTFYAACENALRAYAKYKFLFGII